MKLVERLKSLSLPTDLPQEELQKALTNRIEEMRGLGVALSQQASMVLPSGTKEELQKALANRVGEIQEWGGTMSPSEDNLRLGVKIVGAGLVTAGGIVLLPMLGTALLGAAGFTTKGLAGGSIATAAIQSPFYGGATGGLFSVLQSAGATAAVPALGQVIGGVGLIGGGAGIMRSAGLLTSARMHKKFEGVNAYTPATG